MALNSCMALQAAWLHRCRAVPAWRAGLVLVAILLAGCAASPTGPTQDVPKRPQSLGVVSVVGGELFVFHDEWDIRGSSHREVLSIPDWGIDRVYERQMADALSTLPGVAAAQPLPNPEAFADVNQGFVPGEGKVAHGATNWSGIKDAVRARCVSSSLDGIVIAVQASATGRQLTGGQMLLGAGTYASTRAGVAKVHLIAKLALISCDTASLKAMVWLSKDKADWVSVSSQSMALEDLPAGQFATSMVNWPASRFGEVRSRLLTLPALIWRPALESLLRL